MNLIHKVGLSDFNIYFSYIKSSCLNYFQLFSIKKIFQSIIKFSFIQNLHHKQMIPLPSEIFMLDNFVNKSFEFSFEYGIFLFGLHFVASRK